MVMCCVGGEVLFGWLSVVWMVDCCVGGEVLFGWWTVVWVVKLCDMDLLHAGVCVGLCRDPNLWVVKCCVGGEVL